MPCSHNGGWAAFEPGCEASFLLLLGDPLEDLSHLDQPLLRVKQGRLLDTVGPSGRRQQPGQRLHGRPAQESGWRQKAGKAGSKKQAAKPATSSRPPKANRPASAKTR